MNPSLHFTLRRFAVRVAELDFSAQLPSDWIEHDVVETDADFTDPSRFTPLAVLTAPHAAIVLAVAARPAYDDGTLHDWAWYLLNHNQLAPRAVGRHRVAGAAAVVGEAVQASDLGPMLVRFAFLEEGGRLLNLTLTAPELLAGAVQSAWWTLLESFALDQPRGSRFRDEPGAADGPAAPAPSPGAEPGAAGSDENPQRSTGTTAAGGDVNVDAPCLEACVAEPDAGHPEPQRPPQATDLGPAWWREALALEAQGQLDAAEAHIRRQCPHIGFAQATAEMYRRRMGRLQAAGDAQAALEAFRKSSDFIGLYASMATSGGEGAALSRERDAFRAHLLAEFGSDAGGPGDREPQSAAPRGLGAPAAPARVRATITRPGR